jgi:hypothetical protein
MTYSLLDKQLIAAVAIVIAFTCAMPPAHAAAKPSKPLDLLSFTTNKKVADKKPSGEHRKFLYDEVFP